MTDQAAIARENAMHCEAKKHGYRQTQDGVVVSFVLHPQEVPDGLAVAALGSRYMLALVELNDDETPKEIEKPRAPDVSQVKARGAKSQGQIAAILCTDVTFRAFLNEKHNAGATNADEAAEWLRRYCNVKSRSELTRDNYAWVDLYEDYRGWEIDL